MNIAPAFLKRVPKVVWACILTTLAITAVQGTFSYFFEYEDIVSYTKFYKYLKYLFLFNLILGVLMFSAGKKIIFSVIAQSVLLLGLFFVLMITMLRYKGFFPFYDYTDYLLPKISLLFFILIGFVVVVQNFEFSKIFIYPFIIFFVSLFFYTYSSWFNILQIQNQYKKYAKVGLLPICYELFLQSLFSKDSDIELFLSREKMRTKFKKIVFFHLPKTAGTSIWLHFNKFYPGANESYDEIKSKTKETGTIPYNYFYVQSHFNRIALQAIGLSKDSKFVFFRDPKKRILSDYYFLKINALRNNPDTKTSLLEFLKDSNERFENSSGHMKNNIYARYLINRNPASEDLSENDIKEALEYLDAFDFIGITENSDEDLERLSDFYYLPKMKNLERHNVFHNNISRYKKKHNVSISIEPITPEIDRELDRLTKYDYIIYNEAKKIRDEQASKWRAGEMKRAMGD